MLTVNGLRTKAGGPIEFSLRGGEIVAVRGASGSGKSLMLRAIADLGFEYATPIQSEVMPYSLADYDVTGQAQTGTGKTAAFLITILLRIYEFPATGARRPGSPRSLVLAPTRELAIQIEHE